MQRKLSCLWKEPSVPSHYRAAVSLHSHTNRSKESLTFISKFSARHALTQFALASQIDRAKSITSISVDFARGYWTPPLPPLAALLLERSQIEQLLGLAGMVSLTDHDSIEAPMLLQVVPEAKPTPVSVEWSLPYGGTTLHLGIHNLPSDGAETTMARFAECARNPGSFNLKDLLEALHTNREVLIVLNHPMWDITGIGPERHFRAVNDFVAELGMFVHAFELSGVRSWEENQRTMDFADHWNQLVVGGGDRHGTEPNAVLNLSDSHNFSEFVEEVRRQRRCHVLFMPQYSQPMLLRVLRSILDVVREYPDHPEGSRHWDERVFHPDCKGQIQPLASLWRKPPMFIEATFAAIRLIETPVLRGAIQMASSKARFEQYAESTGEGEVAISWSKTFASRSFRTPTTKLTAWRTRAASLRPSRKNAESPS